MTTLPKIALLALALSGLAGAWSHARAAGDGKTGAIADEELLDPSRKTTVRMPYLTAPVFIDGRLSHYIFITYRLKTSKPGMGERVTADIRYLEDAMLRVVHHHALSVSHELVAPDLSAIKPKLIAAANQALKGDWVIDLLIDRIERPNDPNLESAPAPRPPPAAKKPAAKSGAHH